MINDFKPFNKIFINLAHRLHTISMIVVIHQTHTLKVNTILAIYINPRYGYNIFS